MTRNIHSKTILDAFGRSIPEHSAFSFDLGTARVPIRFDRFDLVRRARKWDKKDRSSLELCHGVDLPRSEPEVELLLLKRKSN